MQKKLAEERAEHADLETGLEAFSALVSSSLERISFENRQKLMRLVLEKVVVKDWRVDVYYKIHLPKPDSPTPKPVSSKFG